MRPQIVICLWDSMLSVEGEFRSFAHWRNSFKHSGLKVAVKEKPPTLPKISSLEVSPEAGYNNCSSISGNSENTLLAFLGGFARHPLRTTSIVAMLFDNTGFRHLCRW